MPRRSNRERMDLPTGQQYGDRQALEEAQSAVSPIPNEQIGLRDLPPNPRSALTAPTMSPNEPVTAGLDIGPGPGPEALMTPPKLIDEDDLLAATRTPILELMADSGYPISQRSRQAIRRLRARTPVT